MSREPAETTTNLSTSTTASLGARIPWPDNTSYANIDPEEALELFLDWTVSQDIELWDHQEEALLDFAAGNHVILATPTGSGKSLVALGMCFISVCTNRRAYYTAPIKALVSEKFFSLVDVFGAENIGMITGDAVINEDAPIICCTAEILAQDALRFGKTADIGCIAMDEFHYFGDRDRGWAWQVPLLTLPHAQFLLMSATLGDVSAITALLERQTERSVDVVANAARPVPLSYHFVTTALEASVKVALEQGEAPIYVVHFSQNEATKSAQALSSFGVSSKEQREELKRATSNTRFSSSFGKTLKRLLLSGVGVHHAGMLPRYRLLVEKLAQQGLLPVICGTDTLGVGINVPIHTVLLTALAKYDGYRMRRLYAREFHQIAGRAGRAGFDSEGVVLAQATEYEIEHVKALAKANGDPKKLRKIKSKTPPKGFIGWKEETFTKLIQSPPETLHPRLSITHALVLSEVIQGGDAYARTGELIDASLQTDEEKLHLHERMDEIFATLLDAGVIERVETSDGGVLYTATVDLPDDFALDQPLSPFLLAALELLDPEDDHYELDLISMVEATLDNPPQILRSLEHQAKDEAMAAMKAEGIDYEERLERIKEVTYPKPLEDLLQEAFERYCREVPWAADYQLYPKSILRDMIETASDFKSYIQRYSLARNEGTLLRYLSDAYHVLARTVPVEKLNDKLLDIVAWLRLMVTSIDSSLIDEWEQAGQTHDDQAELAASSEAPRLDELISDRRGMTILVRNALFHRVRLIAHRDSESLGALDGEWGWKAARWQQALDALYEAHEEVLLDADARSRRYFTIDETPEKDHHLWHVRQMLKDSDGDGDFGFVGDIDLDATQDEGEVVFSTLTVGFIEDLREAGIYD